LRGDALLLVFLFLTAFITLGTTCIVLLLFLGFFGFFCGFLGILPLLGLLLLLRLILHLRPQRLLTTQGGNKKSSYYEGEENARNDR
jgi:hypothetical protein